MTHYSKHQEVPKPTSKPDAAGDPKEVATSTTATPAKQDTAEAPTQSVRKLFTLLRLGNPEVSSEGVGTPGHVCARYASRQALLDALPSWQEKHPSAQLYVQENDVESVDAFKGDAS